MAESVYVRAVVEAAAAEHLVEAVWYAVSPMRLEEWLRNEGHHYFEETFVNRFAVEGDQASGFWAPLSEATQHIREEQGFGPDWPVNIRTNQLFDFVVNQADFHQSASGAEMNIPGDAPNSVVQAKLETAQLGRDSNPIPNFGPTPPRPILALTEVDAAALLKLLELDIINSVVGFSGGEIVA